jgi:hypothetical protein
VSASGWDITPDLKTVAGWAEMVAAHLRARDSKEDWTTFYAALPGLFRSLPLALSGRKIFLTSGDKLRSSVAPEDGRAGQSSAGGQAPASNRRLTLFLPPRGSDESVVALPRSLQSGIAFLDDRLAWHDEALTDARSFLVNAKLVRAYNAAELVSHVGRMSGRTKSPRLRREGLHWVLRLRRQAKRTRAISVEGASLLVPTRGGAWIRATDAHFSAGWPEDTAGPLLEDFLGIVSDTSKPLASIRDRLIPPPSDPSFSGGSQEEWTEFLTELGVKRGLVPIKLPEPAGVLVGREISPSDLAPELGFGASVASDWEAEIRARNAGGASYSNSIHTIDGDLWYLPGQDVHQTWPQEARVAFAELILRWMPRVTQDHLSVSFFSHAARHASRFTWPTPFAGFLKQSPWFPLRTAGALNAPPTFHLPADAWLADDDGNERLPNFMPSPPRRLGRFLARRPEAATNFHRFVGAGSWNEPTTLPRQASAIARVLRNGVAQYDISALKNVYDATWRRVAGQTSDLGWDGSELIIVANGDRFEAVEVGGEDMKQGGPIYVRDSPDDLVIRLMQAAGRRVFDVGPSAAEGIAMLLKPVLKDRARFASSVNVDILIDGRPFSDMGERGEVITSVCPAIRFLVLASAESLSGAAARTLPADRRTLVDRLDQISLVRGGSIQLSIEGSVMPLPHVHHGSIELEDGQGQWVLLETNHGAADWGNLVRAARPVTQLLQQRALEHPLKNAFRALERLGQPVDQPTPPVSVQNEIALELGIDPVAVEAAMTALQGTLAQLIRVLRPVLHYWQGAVAVEQLDEASAEIAAVDDLLAYIQGAIPSFSSEEFQACAEARGLDDVRELLGLDYERFNRAREAVGEEPERHPDLHVARLRSYIESDRERLYNRLRLPFVETFDRRQDLDEYLRLLDRLNSLEPPEDWLLRFHSPPSDALEEFVQAWFDQQKLPLGTDTGDPLPPLEEVRKMNRRKLDKFVGQAAEVVRAWSGIHTVDLPDRWASPTVTPRDLSELLFRAGAFDFRPLSDGDIASWLATLGQWPDGMPTSLDLHDLGIDPEHVAAGHQRQKQDKERAERQERSLEFGNSLIDPAVVDHGSLFDDVSKAVAEVGEKLPEFGDPLALDHATVRPRKVSNRKGRGGGSFRRLHPDKADLIGFIGECAVYNWLKRRFPEKDIDAGWVSGMRSRVLPGEGDDGLGYDFKLSFRRKDWHIEVKAHVGDPCEIELGETEVATASECAGRKNREYLIAYVTHVEDPASLQIAQLPNPLDPSNHGRYHLVGEGLRYRFAR